MFVNSTNIGTSTNFQVMPNNFKTSELVIRQRFKTLMIRVIEAGPEVRSEGIIEGRAYLAQAEYINGDLHAYWIGNCVFYPGEAEALKK